MCQSGACKYEIWYGENAGACTLGMGPWPQDAYCMVRDEELEMLFREIEARKACLSKKKGRFRILELS